MAPASPKPHSQAWRQSTPGRSPPTHARTACMAAWRRAGGAARGGERQRGRVRSPAGPRQGWQRCGWCGRRVPRGAPAGGGAGSDSAAAGAATHTEASALAPELRECFVFWCARGRERRGRAGRGGMPKPPLRTAAGGSCACSTRLWGGLVAARLIARVIRRITWPGIIRPLCTLLSGLDGPRPVWAALGFRQRQ